MPADAGRLELPPSIDRERQMILLTGGAGYIGLHTAAVLIEAGHDVVLFDKLQQQQAARRAAP